MRRRNTAAWARSVVVGLAASCMANAAGAAPTGVTSLQAISATVQNPGDTGQICVTLNTGGAQVAGTQNQLVWDGTCATLTSSTNCNAVGSHGKEVIADSDHQTTDFSVRVIVLSLTSTSPIPNGPLYCCAFEGEADPGQCCNITVIDTNASDSQGHTVPTIGGMAQLCTAPATNQPGRGFGSTGGTNQPLSASNAPTGNDTGSGATTAPPPPVGPAAARPPVQVLPGGGAPEENPAADVPAVSPIATPVQATPPVAAQAPAQPVAGVPPAALPPSTVAATSAPTQAATKAPPADTPTTAPTKAMAAKPQAAAAPADPPKGSGVFGCEIAGATSGAPLVGLVLLALVGRTARRRRRPRRQPDSRTQR